MSTTISDRPTEAFVWVWPPGTVEPVVAGRLTEAGGEVRYVYGASYVARADAISLYTPELPLAPGLDRGRYPASTPRAASLTLDPSAWGSA